MYRVENLWGGRAGGFRICEIFKGAIKKCGFNTLQVEMKAVMTSYCHETDDKYHIIVHTKYMTTNEYYGLWYYYETKANLTRQEAESVPTT